MRAGRRSEAAPPREKAETELAPDDPKAKLAEIKALLLFIIGSLIIGLLLGGRDPGVRSVLRLGTAQRNVAAAIVVSAQNFSGSNTLVLMLVVAILGLLILMPTARQLGSRVQAPAAPTTQTK